MLELRIKLCTAESATTATGTPLVVAAPDLVGQNLSAAPALLAACHRRLGAVTEKPSEQEPPGTIVAQRPAAGEGVVAHAAVAVVVAVEPS